MSVTAVLSFRDAAHILVYGLQLNSLRTAKESVSHFSSSSLHNTKAICCMRKTKLSARQLHQSVHVVPVVGPINRMLLTALTMFWIYKRSYERTNVSECFLVVWPVTLGLSAPQMARIY
jgi:hypothetical protein